MQLGALAQLVARRVRNAKVTGSNPVCSTKSTVAQTRLIVQEDYFNPIVFCNGK